MPEGFRPDRVVAHPSDIERLRKMGYDVDSGQMSLPEFIDRAFSEEAKQQALDRSKKLPARPDIAAPSIMSLYDEIVRCILMGVSGAAITLSTNLVEYMLKYSIYTARAGGFANFDKDLWTQVERTSFEPAIREAAKLGLITKKQNKLLYEFMKDVRDPYNHYNLQRIVAGSSAEKVMIQNLETGEVEERRIEASEDLVIAAQIKPMVDDANVFRHFDIAHQVVCGLYATLVERFEPPS